MKRIKQTKLKLIILDVIMTFILAIMGIKIDKSIIIAAIVSINSLISAYCGINIYQDYIFTKLNKINKIKYDEKDEENV